MTTLLQDYQSSALTDEVCDADLGDVRLNRRLMKIVQSVGAQPNLSIPAATDRRAEMEAAYRFFDNDKVTPQKLLKPHIAATYEPISQCRRVLLVQDTTELDLTRPSRQVGGAGPMDSDVRRGAFVHTMMAFDVNGVPLGTVWQKAWAREAIKSSMPVAERVRLRKLPPIEEKESHRWIEGLQAGRKVAATCPGTTCICVSDSESDIYELFNETQSTEAKEGNSSPPIHVIVRACRNRNTNTGNLLEDVRRTKCLAENAIAVGQRTAKIAVTRHARGKSRDSRAAHVDVRTVQVTMCPPQRHDRKLPELTLNVVLVEETNPPASCEPIRWILVTTLPIDTLAQVQEIVQYYCLRWQIEIFFRTLKTGCRVEERLFERLSRTLNCVAVYSIIAWQITYLCRLGRECPDLSCDVVFSPSEWKSVYRVVRRRRLPSKAPKRNEMVCMIATLGGYVDRPKTQPGPQTLWIGMQRQHCFSLAWDTFGPEQ